MPRYLRHRKDGMEKEWSHSQADKSQIPLLVEAEKLQGRLPYLISTHGDTLSSGPAVTASSDSLSVQHSLLTEEELD